jgi:endonuclease/exonuclease/phosphatase family metal-dependent hydrolase
VEDAPAESDAARRPLRIITYNIHKCVGGLDRACSPERIRDAIAPYEADIVMLQEVVEGPDGPKYFHQVNLLGDLLNLRHRTFFPNVDLLGGARYGNAILSRFPFTETRNIDLAIPLSTRRSGLHARFRVRRPGHDRDARTVHVFNFHLGLTQYLRKWQLRKFLESETFQGLNSRSPVIIAGDFNDVWGSLGEKYLAPAGFRGMPRPLRTFPAWAPVRALDSIYVRGDLDLIHVERPAQRVARWASDHLPLIGDLLLR